MSGIATGWALRNGPRDRAQRAVLVVLADVADRRGEHAHPGLEALVERSLLSEGHVRRCIAKLLADGYIEQTERTGPGRAAEYRILMGEEDETPRTRTRAVAATTPRKTTANGARTPRTRTRAVAASTPITGLRTTVTTNGTDASSDAPGRDTTVEGLCERLATAIGEFQRSSPPPISERWRKDMRLLLERGPLHRREPEPLVAERIEQVIMIVFGNMADPGGDGFCWAAQIRSPGALRDHWDQLRVSYRDKAKGRRNGSDPMTGRHKRTLEEEMRLALGGDT